MRFPIIILMTLCSSFSGFSQIITNDSIPLYFPEYSFNPNKTFDDISNRYWSSYLFGLGKQIIYKDKSIQECYRLIYYGPGSSVVEIFKRGDKYIIISDSLPSLIKSFRRIDSLNKEDLFIKIPELRNLDLYFWDMKNGPYNPDKEYYILNDDRENWLLELKKGDKYNVITRIEPEKEIKDLIIQIMTASKHRGFRIWTSQDNYEEFR